MLSDNGTLNTGEGLDVSSDNLEKSGPALKVAAFLGASNVNPPTEELVTGIEKLPLDTFPEVESAFGADVISDLSTPKRDLNVLELSVFS